MTGRGLALTVLAAGQQSPAALPPQAVPIELMVLCEVSGDRAKPGDPVKLQVAAPVVLAGGSIAQGTPAFGEVVASESSGGAMRRGTVSIRLVRLIIDGRDVPITGEIAARGRGGANDRAITLLAAPFYAPFARGHAGKFKAGDIVRAELPAGFRLGPAANMSPQPVPIGPTPPGS